MDNGVLRGLNCLFCFPISVGPKSYIVVWSSSKISRSCKKLVLHIPLCSPSSDKGEDQHTVVTLILCTGMHNEQIFSKTVPISDMFVLISISLKIRCRPDCVVFLNAS